MRELDSHDRTFFPATGCCSPRSCKVLPLCSAQKCKDCPFPPNLSRSFVSRVSSASDSPIPGLSLWCLWGQKTPAWVPFLCLSLVQPHLPKHRLFFQPIQNGLQTIPSNNAWDWGSDAPQSGSTAHRPGWGRLDSSECKPEGTLEQQA